MKTLVILPGNSKRNAVWNKEIQDRFGTWFDEVYAQSYDHWEEVNGSIDFQSELTKLKQYISSNPEETEYYVFVKSFGTILTLFAIDQGVIAPEKCVLFGLPLNLVEEQNIFNGDWTPLEQLCVPTYVALNIKDPVANYDFTSKKIQEMNPTLHVEKFTADTHAYDEYEKYTLSLKTFLAFGL